MDLQLLLAVFSGIAVLLVLILLVRIHAFISLLISAIVVGLVAGMKVADILSTMVTGMGNTLGFVAVVIGLGAMLGAILEHTGGARSIAEYMTRRFGEKRAPWALSITGFIIAIPVFFDVAFIILVPLINALQKKTGRSLLLYGIPLLAGLGIAHAFIPPTPGPVAVADILNAELSWVILFGIVAGIPTLIIAGPLFGSYIAKRIHSVPVGLMDNEADESPKPVPAKIFGIILLPILLILLNTMKGIFNGSPLLVEIITLLGHPFTALILANLLAWYSLGRKSGIGSKKLLEITNRSIEPVGVIILLTGAGGVLKQILVDTGSGEMLALWFSDKGLGILVLAFLASASMRVLQGSATVAMITAAGLIAPLMSGLETSAERAILVIAIASGASILSHVNDSGFWLVGKYLNLSEKQTFRSWTVMTTLIALSGFAMSSILWALI